jgi:hypothetical protein
VFTKNVRVRQNDVPFDLIADYRDCPEGARRNEAGAQSF